MPCSFTFLGTSYRNISLCMNGYAAAGVSAACSFSAVPAWEAGSSSPRLAPFWADLAADGLLSLAGCSPSVAGQQSRMSWGASSSGSIEVDALVQRAATIPGAASFTSSAYFVATWENVRFASSGSATCNRYTFQLVISVANSSSPTYVLMLFGRMASAAVPSPAWAGLYGGLSGVVWSSSSAGAMSGPLVLGAGSNVGLPGVRVFRVDGKQVQPAGVRASCLRGT